MVAPDSGSLCIDDKRIDITGPQTARAAGIRSINTAIYYHLRAARRLPVLARWPLLHKEYVRDGTVETVLL